MTEIQAIQAKDISPYKHAVMFEGYPHRIASVKHSDSHDTMLINCVNDVTMIANPIAMVSVTLIDDNDDPDPSEPTSARDPRVDLQPEDSSRPHGVAAGVGELAAAA